MRGWQALRGLGFLLGLWLLLLLLSPVVGLGAWAWWSSLREGLSDPRFGSALWLSAWTTGLSVAVVVVSGVPLAWWLSRARGVWARWVSACVELPVILPPAVIGVGLLQTFGRRGLLGGALEAAGVSLPFSAGAVVLAQVIVSAPFFVQGAAAALREVDEDLLLVARTLGASPAAAFWRVALPAAAPGLLASASLAWARALGEFGATLLFAGNLEGRTQTLPLAIYGALESDLRLALVFALALAALGVSLLWGLRAVAARRGR